MPNLPHNRNSRESMEAAKTNQKQVSKRTRVKAAPALTFNDAHVDFHPFHFEIAPAASFPESIVADVYDDTRSVRIAASANQDDLRDVFSILYSGPKQPHGACRDQGGAA